MNTVYLASFQPDQYELSRHAAERYAVLTAIKQQRALNRRSQRRKRVVEPTRQPLAIHD